MKIEKWLVLCFVLLLIQLVACERSQLEENAPTPVSARMNGDSADIDTIHVDSIKVDTIRTDSIRIDSVKVDSVHVVDSLKVNGVDSLKTKRR